MRPSEFHFRWRFEGDEAAGVVHVHDTEDVAEKRAPRPAIERYTAEQRRDGDQVYAPPRMSAADRAVASAEWSRQLREKVDAAKKRDAEKARETHYWDPEGGEW